MTIEMIEKFVENSQKSNEIVCVRFRERSTVSGKFVKGPDYEELKLKNFWRIVSEGKLKAWELTKNIDLTRIYNGVSFSRLTDQ